MPSTAHAATYTLDFDQGANGGEVLYKPDGTLDTTQWASMGLTNITGTNRRTGKAALFNTYDSAYNTQQESNLRSSGLRDDDLRSGSQWGTEAQGNLLIIQEQDNGNKNFKNNYGYYRADDEGRGGNVKFEIDNSVLFYSFSLIGTKRGNNSLYQFDLDANYFANMRVENIEFKYPGSGAIAGIEWSIEDNDTPQEIPESSVIGGLLMVGFLAKKLKRNSNLSEVSELA